MWRKQGLSAAEEKRLLAHVKQGLLTEQEVKLVAKVFGELVPAEWLKPAKAALGAGAIEDLARLALLAERCRTAREKRGLDVKAAAAACKVAQYRIRAIERCQLRDLDPKALEAYVELLGLEAYVARWSRANAKLAARLGIGTAKRAASKRDRRKT